MNYRCAIGLHDWAIEGLNVDLIKRTCKRCGMAQRQYYEDTLLGRNRITWTTSKSGDSTLHCMLGFHDWEYGRKDLHTDTLDRKHKVRPVVIHNHGVQETRICRSCDKRQIMRDGGPEGLDMWETVLPFEGINERFPGNVGIKGP